MKKLISMMLLVLCMLLCTVAQAAVKEDYVGCWELDAVLLPDMIMLDKSEINMTMYVNIHKDDTAAWQIDDMFTIRDISYADDKAYLNLGEQTPLTIDESGRLNLPMTVDGVPVNMKLVRSGKQAVEDVFLPYLGEWESDHVAFAGMKMEIGLTMMAYTDGFGVLKLLDSRMPFRLVQENGVVSMQDSEGELTPMFFNDAGQLCYTFETEGIKLDIVMNKTSAAMRMAAEAGTTALAEPGSFEGRWIALSMNVMGHDFDAEDLGIEYILTIGESSAELSLGGETALMNKRMEDDVLYLSNASREIPCLLDEFGRLCMTLETDGIMVTVFMVRQ